MECVLQLKEGIERRENTSMSKYELRLEEKVIIFKDFSSIDLGWIIFILIIFLSSLIINIFIFIIWINSLITKPLKRKKKSISYQRKINSNDQ